MAPRLSRRLSRTQMLIGVVGLCLTVLLVLGNLDIGIVKRRKSQRRLQALTDEENIKYDPAGNPLPQGETHKNWQIQVKAQYPDERLASCGNAEADEKLKASFQIVEMLVTVDHRYPGTLDGARASLLEAAKAAPLCITPMLNLAILYIADGQDDKAAQAIQEAARLAEPASLKGKVQLWSTIIKEVRGNNVENEYRQVIGLYPSYGMEYFGVKDEKVSAVFWLVTNTRVGGIGRVIGMNAMRSMLLAKEYLYYFGGYPVITREEAQMWPEHWYIFLRNVLPPFALQVIQRMYRELILSGSLVFKDPQSTRYISYNDPATRFLQAQFAEMVGRIVDEPVKPTYTYFGGYVGSSILPPHTDRQQCEFTMTVNIDTNPLDMVCPIGLTPKAHKGITQDWRGNSQEDMPPPNEQLYVYPKPGDSLLFKGRHLIHWRNEMPPNVNCSQIFLHFVKDSFDLALG